MKIALLMKIARQVEGEFVFVSVEQANIDPEAIRKYLYNNQLPRTEKIQNVDCVIEYGVVTDVEVEGTTSDSQDQS